MSYLIGSGYVPSPSNEKFLEIWADNFTKHPVPDGCSRIVIAGVGDGPRPVVSVGFKVEWVGLQGNLGHVGDLIHGRKDYEICGWTAAVCALAMLAYCDESDFRAGRCGPPAGIDMLGCWDGKPVSCGPRVCMAHLRTE